MKATIGGDCCQELPLHHGFYEVFGDSVKIYCDKEVLLNAAYAPDFDRQGCFGFRRRELRLS